jgi:hypothetical protein
MNAPAASAERLFGILMTRNDADLLRANILFHLSIGCERILVVDNGSTDRTRSTLRWLARLNPVDWTSRDDALPDPEIVTELAHEARAQGADWVLPLDTDEFWRPTRPLDEILAGAGSAGALGVDRIEFVQARDQLRSRMADAVRADRRVASVLDGEAAVADFLAGARSQFELAPPLKLLIRTNSEMKIELGAHRVHGLDGPVVATGDITILHLALRSNEEALSRLDDDRLIRRVDERPEIVYESKYWVQMSETGRLEAAWRAHSHEDGALDVFGRRVELVEDRRLAELLAPFAVSPLRQHLGDIKRHLRGGLRRCARR